MKHLSKSEGLIKEILPEISKTRHENGFNENAVPHETREMNESTVPNELPVDNKVEVIKEVAEINENKVEHLSKSEGLVKEIVPEVSETINENVLNESAVLDETGEMNENTLNGGTRMNRYLFFLPVVRR